MARSIGNTIYELRVRNNLTQQELADRLHLTVKSISNYECKISEPPLNVVMTMSDLFGVSTDVLLGRLPIDSMYPSYHSCEIGDDELLGAGLDIVGRNYMREQKAAYMKWHKEHVLRPSHPTTEKKRRIRKK